MNIKDFEFASDDLFRVLACAVYHFSDGQQEILGRIREIDYWDRKKERREFRSVIFARDTLTGKDYSYAVNEMLKYYLDIKDHMKNELCECPQPRN